MYTPYLKGKQFEFLALRDLAEFFSPEEKENDKPFVDEKELTAPKTQFATPGLPS